jgi:hypothetical protein
MIRHRVIFVLLIITCLLAAGCVDSMQPVLSPENRGSSPDNTTSPAVPDGGSLQVPGMQATGAGGIRQVSGERIPPPTPDARQAHVPLVGPYGDLSRNVISQQDPGSTESTTGSASGSSGSSSLPVAAAEGAGLTAPMPASGLGSFTEPGQNNLPVPGTGSNGNPPGEYYEGAGAVITPFATRDPNSCGCAM